MYQHGIGLFHKMCFKQVEEQIIVAFYRLNEQLKNHFCQMLLNYIWETVLIQFLLCSYLLEVRRYIKEVYVKVKFISYNHFMTSLETFHISL